MASTWPTPFLIFINGTGSLCRRPQGRKTHKHCSRSSTLDLCPGPPPPCLPPPQSISDNPACRVVTATALPHPLHALYVASTNIDSSGFTHTVLNSSEMESLHQCPPLSPLPLLLLVSAPGLVPSTNSSPAMSLPYHSTSSETPSASL